MQLFPYNMLYDLLAGFPKRENKLSSSFDSLLNAESLQQSYDPVTAVVWGI